MPNIAAVLKDEIVRLARKELRGETAGLKRASAQYRSEIAALKRRVADLERQFRQLEKQVAKSFPLPAPVESKARVRYSAKSLRSQRRRLGLAAGDIAKLVGVSPQTVYNWEAETTRPRVEQFAAIAALRTMGKKDALERLGQIAA